MIANHRIRAIDEQLALHNCSKSCGASSMSKPRRPPLT